MQRKRANRWKGEASTRQKVGFGTNRRKVRDGYVPHLICLGEFHADSLQGLGEGEVVARISFRGQTALRPSFHTPSRRGVGESDERFPNLVLVPSTYVICNPQASSDPTPPHEYGPQAKHYSKSSDEAPGKFVSGQLVLCADGNIQPRSQRLDSTLKPLDRPGPGGNASENRPVSSDYNIRER